MCCGHGVGQNGGCGCGAHLANATGVFRTGHEQHINFTGCFVHAHDAPCVKVVLLHPPAFERDFVIQRRTKAKDQPAFDLGYDLIGVKHAPAIHHGRNTVDNNVVRLGHFHFRNAGHVGAKGKLHGHTPGTTGGEGGVPACGQCHLVQHSQCAWVMGQHGPPVSYRVHACAVGQFVNKPFHHKQATGAANATPPCGCNTGGFPPCKFQPVSRVAVGRNHGGDRKVLVIPILGQLGGVPACHHGGADYAVGQGGYVALVIQCRSHLVHIGGAVTVARQIFFPAPDDFERVGHLACKLYALCNVFMLQPAAKASANILAVYGYFIFGQAGQLGSGIQRPVGNLGASPYVAPIGADMGCAVYGLHRSMGQQWLLVGGRVCGVGTGNNARCICLGVGNNGRTTQPLMELVVNGLGGYMGIGAIMPLGLKGAQAFAGRPVVVSNNTDGIILFVDQHSLHTTYGKGCLPVHPCECATFHRAGGNGANFLARNLHIHAKNRATLHFYGAVYAVLGMTEQRIGCRVFKRWVFGYGQCCSLRCNRTKRQGAASWHMGNDGGAG